ncbi:nucleoside monophosphate kinase [Streptomyces virginiae]|uniref:nucleoside monophosphate kinase n=1 Tax=Streptomyces virginiae TaxID=1961 RepID=UPI0036A17B2E
MDFTLELVRHLASEDPDIRETWRTKWKDVKLHQRRANASRKNQKRAGEPAGSAQSEPARLPVTHGSELALSSARDEAAQTLSEARRQAEEVLSAAREQADQILRAAEHVLQSVRAGKHTAIASPHLLTRGSMRVILLGPPAGGKGTQGALLSRELQVPSIHIGSLFRQHIKEGSELGLIAQRCVREAELIPDEVILGMIKQRLDTPDAQRGFLLDGFPRTFEQADSLDDMLFTSGWEVDAALHIDIPRDEALKRLPGRRLCLTDHSHVFHLDYAPPNQYGICNICAGPLALRDADSAKTTGERWDFWEVISAPVAGRYQDRGRLTAISGLGEVRDVTDRATGALAALLD